MIEQLIFTAITAIFISGLTFWSFEWLANNFKRFRKDNVIFIHSNWNDISTIPKHISSKDSKELILTDGKVVSTSIRCCLRYNELGQVTLGWSREVATHWQYMPSPPKDNK